MTRDRGSSSLTSGRCLAVWLTLTAVLGATGRVLIDHLGSAPLPTDRFDLLLVSACEMALLGAVTWLWGVSTIVALDAARGLTRHHRGVPAPLRRALLAACGAALAGGLTGPVWAAGDLPVQDGRAGSGSSAIEGLSLPDRQSAASAVAALVHDQVTRTRAESARSVVVAPGDTLWALAADTLPRGASDADVAKAVRRVHVANLDTIGHDPDVITPGQVLHLPHHQEESR